MNREYAEALAKVVERTVQRMFHLETRLVGVQEERSQEAPFDISGIIGITSVTRGSIVISFPLDVARKMTEWLLKENGGEGCSEQDISDCIGELTNIIAGNMLAELRGVSWTSARISLPSVVVGSHKIVWSRKDIPYDLISFETDYGRFAAEINLRTPITSSKSREILNIMIVDDSRVMRRMLQSAITGGGFENCTFVEAADGQQALRSLEERGYDVDAVFCDLCMPNMDGLGLIDALAERQVLGRCPVIVLTGDTREGRGQRALARGARRLIAKPFTNETVADALEEVLALDPVS